MKHNKLFILSVAVLVVVALWFVANNFSDRDIESEEQIRDVDYQGPPEGSVPGEGFRGPTSPHP